MIYVANALNIIVAALCCTAIVGAWYAKRDSGGTWYCPIANPVIGVVTSAAVLAIINCFI